MGSADAGWAEPTAVTPPIDNANAQSRSLIRFFMESSQMMGKRPDDPSRARCRRAVDLLLRDAGQNFFWMGRRWCRPRCVTLGLHRVIPLENQQRKICQGIP